jgi:hypothetical protein
VVHPAREEHRNILPAGEEERRTGLGELRKVVASVEEALRTAEAAAVRMALVAGDIGLVEGPDNSLHLAEREDTEREDTGPVAEDTGPEEAGNGPAEGDIGLAEEGGIGRSLEAALRCVRLSTEVARGQQNGAAAQANSERLLL